MKQLRSRHIDPLLRFYQLSPCSNVRSCPIRSFVETFPSQSKPVTESYNDASTRAFRGGLMDPQLKQLMKELGDAINESLSESS